MTWTQTFSGRAVNLLKPQAADIVFEDVAHHLAYVHRFNGAIEYTNAQHSVLVASIVWQTTKSEEATIHGLLHDAHEAPMGDVIGPLRAALKVLLGDAFKQALGLITSNTDAAIREAFNLDAPSDEIARQVISADQRALFIERAMFMAPPPAPWPLELSSYDETHRVAFGDLDVEWNRTILSHIDAEEAFTWTFDELRHRLGRAPLPVNHQTIGRCPYGMSGPNAAKNCHHQRVDAEEEGIVNPPYCRGHASPSNVHRALYGAFSGFQP